MNRKILCFLCLLLLLNCETFGQSREGKLGSLFAGARVGMNTSFLSQNNLSLTKGKAGVNGGLYVGYSITDQLSVSFEPMYSQIGSNDINPSFLFFESVESEFLNDISEMNLRIHSLNFPIIASAFLGGSDTRPRVFLGASYDYNHWATTQNTQIRHNYLTDEDKQVTTYTAVDDRIQDHGISGIIGVGAVVYQGSLVISFDIRGVYSFDNLNAAQTSNPLYNRGIIATIGFGL